MFATHFSDTLAGRVFTQNSTPVGVALPLYTTTAAGTTGICGMPLWNPPGSNRNIELIEAVFAYASGTTVQGGIVIMGVPLTAVGTGNPCTALISSSPVNQLYGAGQNPKTFSYSGNAASSLTVTAGTTLPPTATAPGVCRTIGSMNAVTTSGNTTYGGYYFNGTGAITPGFLIYFAATLASVGLFCASVTWKEIPIVPAQG